MARISKIRNILLMLLAASTAVSLFLGTYIEEVGMAIRFLNQVRRFLAAKQTFPPLSHQEIGVWNEPKSREELFGNNNNSKLVWGYWHGGKDNLPGFCQLAVRSWRVHHPDWTIILMDRNNYKQYVSHLDLPSTFHSLKVQHQSDMIRLAVMRRYGGLYLDISYVLFKNLDELWDRAHANGDLYLTAPISLAVEDVRPELMAFPNNAFLLSTRPQNPVLVSWQRASLEYLENPVYTMDEIKAHPIMRRVKKFIGHPDLGPTKDLAPYVCNLWTLADTLYFEAAVRSYVRKHVYILPTLMWTFDFVMVELGFVDAREAPYKVYTSESWTSWLQRIPSALTFFFGDSQEMVDKTGQVSNAMKVSSDLCLWWEQPLEFHLGQQSSVGRVWRAAVDTTMPNMPANLEGIHRWIPFDDDALKRVENWMSSN